MEKKKVVERGESTKGGQLGSLAEISHQQSQWIIRTYVRVTKKKKHNTTLQNFKAPITKD